MSEHISLLEMKNQMQSLRPGSSKAAAAAQGLCMLIQFKGTLLCSLLSSKQLWGFFSLLALCKSRLEINTPHRDFGPDLPSSLDYKGLRNMLSSI